jgi:prepilin-type N-terminal cleavage/methylation domain-containing protein
MPLPRADAELEMNLLPVAAVYDRRSVASRRSAVIDRRYSFCSAQQSFAAFTLIELLVVITIIAVLIGFLFPAFQGIQNQAKKTQAKNDLLQIVTALNAYYTEYGKYPLTPSAPADTTYGSTTTNDRLFNILRSVNSPTDNPRGIVFLSPPDAKDRTNPKAGISTASASVGQYFDPWGKPYMIRIDTDYDNQVPNPYSANAGNAPLRSGVIAWSFGKDTQSESSPGPAPDKNSAINKDDVISWQ